MKAFFSLLWRGWKKFAHVLGIINTKILLSITYFIMMGLISTIGRLFGADLLDRRMKPKESYYHERENLPSTLEACRRQF